MNYKVVAVIPAYNEEKNLKSLLKEIKKYIKNVIIVADGSTDNTALVAKKNGALVPNPVTRRGKGNAIIRGIGFSKKLSPDVIIFMDSDGEHEPKYIPHFLELLKNNDFVVGQRVFYRSEHRRLVNKFNNFWMNLIIPQITDMQCGFRAVKMSLLKKMNLTSKNFQIEQEMVLEAVRNKAKIKGIDIKSKPKSKTNLKTLDYLQINNFFDKWIIKNYKYLGLSFSKKIMLLPSVVIGLSIGLFLEKILKMDPLKF